MKKYVKQKFADLVGKVDDFCIWEHSDGVIGLLAMVGTVVMCFVLNPGHSVARVGENCNSGDATAQHVCHLEKEVTELRGELTLMKKLLERQLEVTRETNRLLDGIEMNTR